MADYKPGDQVEYRPVGGESDNVNHSIGVITNVEQAGDGTARYTIRDNSTGKATTYQDKNIVGKA